MSYRHCKTEACGIIWEKDQQGYHPCYKHDFQAGERFIICAECWSGMLAYEEKAKLWQNRKKPVNAEPARSMADGLSPVGADQGRAPSPKH